VRVVVEVWGEVWRGVLVFGGRWMGMGKGADFLIHCRGWRR
jgi:hypothetical protein